MFVKEILGVLFAFYAIYVLLDVMNHIKEIVSGKTSLFTWILYYFSSFSKRLDILVPFAILIATIRTLHRHQQRGELIAMLASGTSRTSLMLPYIIVCCCCTVFLLANYNFVYPYAISEINQIREADFHEKNDEIDDLVIKQVLLEDSSRIIYRSYNREEKTLQHVFWVQNPIKLFYIKKLSLNKNQPIGHFVDAIERREYGNFEKVASWKEYTFTDLYLNSETLKESSTLPHDRSLWRLSKELIVYSRTNSSLLPEIKATLLYKLTFPLLCLVAFFGPAIRLLRFGRVVPILMIYLVSIAGLFFLNLLFQALFVICKNNLISPIIGLTLPWGALLYWQIREFVKGR